MVLQLTHLSRKLGELEMYEVLENVGKAVVVGGVSGLSANGAITFLDTIMDKALDTARTLIKENPNITHLELLDEFKAYNAYEFNSTMVITFVGLGLAALTYLFLYKPFYATPANVEQINDSPQESEHTPSTKENVKAIAKGAGKSLVVGSALTGTIYFILNTGRRNYTKNDAEKLQELMDIVNTWTYFIDDKLIIGTVFMLTILVALTPFFARKPIKALFWSQNDSNNRADEDSRLVNRNRVSAAESQPEAPAAFNNL